MSYKVRWQRSVEINGRRNRFECYLKKNILEGEGGGDVNTPMSQKTGF